MNALVHSPAPIQHAAAIPLLRTLVLCDIVDSTALTQRLGDQRAADLFRKHDRLARALLPLHGGREIDKTDGFLLMFERPVQAVAFALDYQRALRDLNAAEGSTIASRVGIHVGDVVAWDNSPEDIARGAKPIEVEGLVKPITSRLMQLALPNQILLSGVAHALAHRAQGELGDRLERVRWRTHGRYRFKGVPDPIPVFEVGDEGFAPLKAPPWSGKAHREVPFWRRPATLGIELAVLFVLLAIPAWYLIKPAPAIAFANRDWVVVGDLKNLTGDTRFDESVATAFRLALEQSRYVNVLSDLKTRETVSLMNRDVEATRVDRVVGSEVAIRDGARALILPTVAEIGGRVRVTAEVIDPNTQTTVWSESADGVGEESVLPSLDTINRQLRVRLGEALATVSQESRPLASVATRNLDALRAYTLAIRAYNTGHRREAITLFEQALTLDAEFALARIGLARVYLTTEQKAEERAQISKAVALRQHLSPRDGLYVDAWQSLFGPQVAALEKWKALSDTYPTYFAASGTYGYYLWQWANRFDLAIEATKKNAVSQNPNRAVGAYLLGFLYLGQERYQEALASFADANAAGAISRNEFYASAYAAQRRFKQAEEALAAGHQAGVPSEDVSERITRAAILLDQGKWSDTLDQLKAASADAVAIGPNKVSQFHAIQLTLSGWSGTPNKQALRDYFAKETDASKNIDAADRGDRLARALLAGVFAARAGDVEPAGKAIAAPPAEVRDGQYPLLGQLFAVAQAEKLRAENEPLRAIERLTPLLDGSELCLVHASLMDAYADSHQPQRALVEAKWLAEHRGRAYAEHNIDRILTPFNVAQTNLALLRAAEFQLAVGHKDEARKALADFRSAWPASSDVPTVAKRVDAVKAAIDASDDAPAG
ncbi:MAG TPA: putative peptide modification system cyclase [Dokdonella sp.]|nr:putative peptide modification system cyclase [Dokdonella sp.]